ncbi:MAG: hypothetical protein ACLQU4_12645 [Limisphaerales bacterium]
MARRFFLLLVLGGFCLGARAAVLPAEKLLPKDTALVVTMPDSRAAWTIVTNSPYGRLWQDPAVKPFKEKFLDKFGSDVLTPLERSLGIHFSDYSGLAQGQATFALLPMPAPERMESHFAWLFLLDAKDQAARLQTNLADIRQKWAAAGKPMKTLKIHDVDCVTLLFPSEELSWDRIMSPTNRAAGGDDIAGKASTNKVEITFGQAGSLLLVSDSPQAIEKVLIRQAGGLLPALEEQPAFQADFAGRLRGAPLYVWVNIKDSIDILTKTPASDDADAGNEPALKADSPLVACGLTGLTSACFAYKNLPEGLGAQLFVGVPESKRRGLVKALAGEALDANPPAFVPADVTKFWRWRINIPHSWAQIESMLNELNPQYSSVINFVLQTAGKDKDPNYDLKSELLGNLGDDIIHYEKAPQGNTLADLNSAASLYLISSPDPGKLAAALKTGLSFLGTIKDREFLGRKIYTLTPTTQNASPSRSFNFAGSSGYVALSGDSGILEEFLRSNDSKGKTLGDTPGLADAAQKAGGMGTGLFGFENQNLAMRALLEMFRTQPVTVQEILGATGGLPSGVNTADEAAKLRQWADFSLLPPYDTISPYFYFSVYSGGFTPDGFNMTFFAPTPPKLR